MNENAKTPNSSLANSIVLCAKSLCSVKADFHSVRNVARSIFSERFLLKCVKSITANEICTA